MQYTMICSKCVVAGAICAMLAAIGSARPAIAEGPNLIEFAITIDGTQEFPPIETAGSGAGTATLDPTTNLFSWEITFAGLGSNETAAHFHGPAPLCENAGIQVPLPLGSPKIGSTTLTNQQVEDLMLGLWYVNIHSENHPPGEIRGQVVPPPLLDPLPPIAQGAVHIVLEPVATGLTSPLFGAENPADPTRLFVPDQDGVLWAIGLENGDKTVFLDVTDRIVDLGIFGPNTFDERGLLGVAFHPDYATNGLLYTYTSEPLDGPADFSTMPPGTLANHQSVIIEWQVPDPTDTEAVPDPNSARVLLRVDQPQFNHNGGALAFGPDGMLYISIGDGGGADDMDGQPSLGVPMIGHGCIGNGQDPSNPLGAILRIDPLGDNSDNGQYGIPADNPFVGQANFLDENFAYGLRNPWRMSFDSLTGEFYVGDVGQNDIEEVNIVNAGDNLGWNHKEGSFFFIRNGAQPGYITDREQAPSGDATDFVDPIAEYHNATDGIAVIGGFVYRGGKIGPLEGRYVFGDWSMGFATPGGRLFYLADENEPVEFAFVGDEPFEAFVLGFGQDASGELYVMTNQTGTPFGDTGTVYRIRTKIGDLDASGVVGVPDLLMLLAQWGPCTPGESCPADLNGDGNVGVPDLLILLANWG